MEKSWLCPAGSDGQRDCVSVSDNDDDKFRTIIDAPASVEAPVVSGQKLGTVRVLYEDKEFASIELVATKSVERKTFFGMLWGTVWNFFVFD